MKGRAADALDETVETSVPAADAAREDGADAPREDIAGVTTAGHEQGAAAAEDDDGARVRGELAALNDRHLRLAAEFDNYRKRTERERSETWARSQADLAAGLLDVLDDLGRVTHVDAGAATAPSVIDGVRLVERKLLRALSAAGLEEIDAEGQSFDPASMEALMTVEADSAAEDDTVAAVFQKGYRFKGQLLRPARVQVRKYNG